MWVTEKRSMGSLLTIVGVWPEARNRMPENAVGHCSLQLILIFEWLPPGVGGSSNIE